MKGDVKPAGRRRAGPGGFRALPALVSTLATVAVAATPGRASAEEEEAAAPSRDAEATRSPYRWYVLPNAAFDTDDGLGFGLRGELAIDEPGYTPYRESYVLHAFGTLNNYHHHRFRFDRTGLGPDGRIRLTIHVAYRQWGNDGYWGIGNGTTREREYASGFGDDDPRRKRYRYDLIQPFLHVTLRARMDGGFELFCSVDAKWTYVQTYPLSLLAEQRPYGMDGGLTVLVSAGLIYDTREPEVEPRRGVLFEASGQWAVPLPWGPGRFAGAFLSLRGYRQVFPWLTLAGRVMAELLAGDVPFYEMVHWRGAIPVAGFGGFETVRGIPFGRFRAPGKAVANAEARFNVFEQQLFGRPLVWQVALFSDAGIVFNSGEPATAPSPSSPLHVTAGLGLRLAYAESFVGRIDTAIGRDPILEPDGTVTDEISWGLYVVFDQAF